MKTKYIINPSFRFHTWCLVVEWHEVPYNILQSESQYPCEGRSIYAKGKQCQVMAQTNENKIDFYYHLETVFENRNVQAWLRNIIKNINPAKRNVLDLKNETCKNREKRNVLKFRTHDTLKQ